MKTTLLCILDGFGEQTGSSYDAISAANTPNIDKIFKEAEENNLRASLQTSGLSVGLPEGQMGNSEVGHMNIGGGRVVMQTLPKIDAEIENDTLKNNKIIQKQITTLKQTGGSLHLLGLISDGGVHSHISHVIALAKIFDAEDIPVNIHIITDGRDTPPDSAKRFVGDLLKAIAPLKNISIATIAGRYYAMDRDKRWDRVELAYNALIQGNSSNAEKFTDAIAAVDASYKNNKQDEFILPQVNQNYTGAKDGDGFLFANFRADRARQTSLAIGKPEFSDFVRKKIVKFSTLAGLVEYSEEISKYLDVIFETENLTQTLGEIVAAKGMKQLRIAETEKYAHVTFFFNGGSEAVFEGEDRILVPSPNVATYDLQPEMSSVEVTDKLVAAIESGKYGLIVCNYANADMVGHSGIMSAAIKAVEAIDAALGRLDAAIKKTGGVMLISADHGNVEQMEDPHTHEPHTAHTTGPVPFVITNYKTNTKLKNGKLADIAPTILGIMGLPKPVEMNGNDLLA
jgi:2,3-bisphosphoglycerate-independent phosphoglycerate mutase